MLDALPVQEGVSDLVLVAEFVRLRTSGESAMPTVICAVVPSGNLTSTAVVFIVDTA